jgi:carbon-monoxide dehydrogenase medium subunit
MRNFVVHAPRSLQEVSELLGRYQGEARPIAGGTALVLMLREGLIEPEALVRLDHVPALADVGAEDGILRLGARTVLREVAESPSVRAALPLLADACRLVGNVRVRNAATIGGNLCEADYASDPPAVLFALDARVRVHGTHGEREIPVAHLIRDFYETSLQPDEIVTEVAVPLPAPGTRAVYRKYVTRSSEDRPCVGTVAVLRLDTAGRLADLRVAVGAVASTPVRLPEVERSALGEAPSDALFEHLGERYAEAIDPVSDARGSAAYRKRMVAIFVRRALRAALDGEPVARKV